MLEVVVISVDAYPFLVLSDLICHLGDTGIGLSNCNWTRALNHLVHKGTLNLLAKLTK